MRLLRHASLQQKLVTIIMITTGVALLVTAVALVVYEIVMFRADTRHALTSMADVIGANSTAALEFSDPEAGDESLRALATDPNIVAARIYDSDGKPFATYYRSDITAELAPPGVSIAGRAGYGGFPDIMRPIRFGGETIGYVYIQTDRSQISARIGRYTAITAGVLSLSILLALFLSSRLQRVISGPVLHLALTASKVSAKKDFSLRATKHGEDEIGTLTDRFNEMLSQIQSQDAALRATHGELKLRAEELQSELAGRRKAQESLQYRLELEKIITSISAAFINVDSTRIDQTIIEGLRSIGEFMDVDQCNVIMFSEDMATIDCTHEWSRPGVDPMMGRVRGLPVDGFPWWMEEIRKGDALIISSPEDLPPFARGTKEMMEHSGLLGIIAVRMVYGGEMLGYITFASRRPGQAWADEDIALLKMVAETFVDALGRKKAEGLRASLAEKEVLLKEIHHRVKNNLQIISSLLHLQSRNVTDARALEMLREGQNRVQSMALIHENLYRSQDLANVDFGEYVKTLVAHLFSSYGGGQGKVNLIVEVDRVPLSIDTAIPCGLIINELVTNSLKYAFPKGRKGEIQVCLHLVGDGEVALTVSDNGVGLPPGFDIERTESLGLRLVTTLADQIDGRVHIGCDVGSEFKISFRTGLEKVGSHA